MAKAAAWPSDTLPLVQPGNEITDIVRRQLLAVALLADEFLSQHQMCSREIGVLPSPRFSGRATVLEVKRFAMAFHPE
jgi:hypothetical protein